MTDPASQGEFKRFKKNFRRLGEIPVIRYVRWSRDMKTAYKRTFKGLLKTLKGLAFILVILASAMHIPEIPPGMGLVIILLGFLGIVNFARGINLMIRARRSAKRSREETGHRKKRYVLLWTNMTFLIAIVSITFLFIIERLSAPQELRGDQKWFVWPVVYLGMFIIWSIVARSMVLCGARAFKVGDRLARVQHDRRLFKKKEDWKKKKRRFVLFAGYLPVIGLSFIVLLIVSLKLLLRFLMELAFDIEGVTSIGEETIRVAIGNGYSLGDISGFFTTWYGPLILYIGVIMLIGVFSNLRTKAMIWSQGTDRYYSHMGKRITLAKDLRKSLK